MSNIFFLLQKYELKKNQKRILIENTLLQQLWNDMGIMIFFLTWILLNSINIIFEFKLLTRSIIAPYICTNLLSKSEKWTCTVKSWMNYKHVLPSSMSQIQNYAERHNAILLQGVSMFLDSLN